MEDNMSIFPEKVVRTQGPNGKSVWSEVYSLDTFRDIGFIGLVLVLVVTAIIMPFFSALLLLAYITDLHLFHKPIHFNIIGFIISVYLLIDMYNGWILSTLISIFSPAAEQPIIRDLNVATALTHLCLFFLGGTIYKIVGESKFLATVIFLALGFGLYMISADVYQLVLSLRSPK